VRADSTTQTSDVTMSAKGCFDDCTTDCCPDTYDKFRENRNKISSALAGALVSPQLLFL
jgi:hypothetical protein